MSVGQRSHDGVLASRRSGAAALACAGFAWAALCVWLARDGHGPSHTLIPIAREHYYLAQAVLVVPVLFLQWLVCTRVCTRVARGLGAVDRAREPAGALAHALALPILVLLVVPDALVYAGWGFLALGKLVRITAPLSFALSIAIATRALVASYGLTLGRALVSAACGVMSQALLGALVLR